MAKKLNGTVVSNAQDKTIVVRVDRRVAHPLYSKRYTVSKRVQAHDEKNDANIGDVVELAESRPISKTKKFKLVKVLERAPGQIEVAE